MKKLMTASEGPPPLSYDVERDLAPLSEMDGQPAIRLQDGISSQSLIESFVEF